MSDLIDRQSAIDALNEYFDRIGKLKRRGLNKGEKAIRLDTVGTINSLPPAEPKMGKWIYQIGMIKCDQCLRAIRRIDHDGLLNFCPNCGADMRGEQE